MSTALQQEIDDTQRAIDRWYQQSSSNLQMNHTSFLMQLRQAEERLSGEPSMMSNTLDAMITPNRPIFSDERPMHTPAMSSPPLGHPAPLNYDSLLDEVVGMSKPANLEAEAERRKRPDPSSIKDETSPPSDRDAPCQVLVEFKRKRILQYESPCYVAPGEFVVVGGDRGEDIGLVTHTWSSKDAEHPGEKFWTEGVGRVQRVASALEVTQLQGVQTELENRAVEVAQEKAQEHALPMRIVDAEYQFDRRKLTFYYQSQRRLDFRNLVRDLYKTFRARIWMEPDNIS